MSTTTYTSVQAPVATANRTGAMIKSFSFLLWRDLWVTIRDWRSFLATTLIQPVLFLFIFGSVLPQLGQMNRGYANIILPGIIGLTTLITAMTAVIIPLAVEFGYTKEIEDRLLSPVPIWSVGLEKLVFAAIRGLVAGALIFPLGWIILGSAFSISTEHIGLFLLVTVFGAFSGAAIGLTFGTSVPPNKVGLVLPLVLPPMLFTGCVYYPWVQLSRLRWFQVITCLSPLTYTSEGLRAALSPQIPHMPIPIGVLAQVVSIIIFGYLGVRGFIRKSLE